LAATETLDWDVYSYNGLLQQNFPESDQIAASHSVTRRVRNGPSAGRNLTSSVIADEAT
jgi:hypothetical protein